MTPRARGILRIDSLGGIAVGGAVLVGSRWLTELYGLPYRVIVSMAIANLAYGSFSGGLLRVWMKRGELAKIWISVLATANVAWLGVCAWVLVSHLHEVSVFGLAHLVIEGLYVAALGIVETIYVRPDATVVRQG